jgi:hypothetical protein
MRTCPLHSGRIYLQSAARKLPCDLYGQRHAEGCMLSERIGHWNRKSKANQEQSTTKSNKKTVANLKQQQKNAVLLVAYLHASRISYQMTQHSSDITD